MKKLLVSIGLAWAMGVAAQPTCDPAVGQTATLPDRSMPESGWGYLGWRVSPEPFTFRYFYCLQNNKWIGYYGIFRLGDIGFLSLPAGTTLEHFAKQKEDEYYALPSREAKQQFILDFSVKYKRDWGTCKDQFNSTPPGPHADICKIVNDVVIAEKPADPPPPAPSFVINGLIEGQSVVGPISVEAAPAAGVVSTGFTFSLINPTGVSVFSHGEGAAPYCLNGDNGSLPCTGFDTKVLPDGAYTLHVLMSYSGGSIGKDLHITVANAAPPLPPVVSWVVAPTTLCPPADKIGTVCAWREVYSWDKVMGRGKVIAGVKAKIGDPCVLTIGANPYFGYDSAKQDQVTACVIRK